MLQIMVAINRTLYYSMLMLMIILFAGVYILVFFPNAFIKLDDE